MSKKYSQHFREQWLSDSRFQKWLLKIDGDISKCFCKYCKCSMAARLSDIERHRNTTKHQKAEQPFSTQRQTKIAFDNQKDDVKETEGCMSLFIAGHSSLRVVDHLSELCKVHFSDSKGCKNFKLRRTKCKAVISNVLAPYFTTDLIADISKSKYSLLIDESNDISETKLLGVAIRYYSETRKQFVVTYLDLVEVSDCNAQALCIALKDCLNKNGLELQRLVGLGTDNASVMTGVNNGVYTKLKSEVPHLVLVRELVALINDAQHPLKLVQLSQTRWMSIHSAIVRILQQWVELRTHFDIARLNERCYTAELLHSMFSDMNNYVFLIFLKHILGEVQSVNKKFEADIQDPTKLLSDLVQLTDSISSKIAIPGKKITESDAIQDFLDPNLHLGYEFEKELADYKFPDEKEIRGRCIQFLIELLTQLRLRLPDNVRLLQSMSCLSGSECLQPMKPCILNLAKMFVEDADTLTRIDFQWRRLHHMQWTQTSDTLGLWAEIASYRDATGENPFQDLTDFALTVLILPHSNANVESIFSQMGVIKSKLWNRLSIKSLTAVLTIRYGMKRYENENVQDKV